MEYEKSKIKAERHYGNPIDDYDRARALGAFACPSDYGLPTLAQWANPRLSVGSDWRFDINMIDRWSSEQTALSAQHPKGS